MASVAIPTSEIQDLTDYFDTCRRKRNHIDYDGSQIVSGTETDELISNVKVYRGLVETWIDENYPHLS